MYESYIIYRPEPLFIVAWLMFIIAFLVVCFVWHFDKHDIEGTVLEKFYRTPLAILCAVFMGLFLLVLDGYVTSVIRDCAVDIVKNANVESVDDDFVYFEKDGTRYKLGVNVFGDAIGDIK